MCSIRGIVSIGAIAPTIFEDIYIDTYEIFYHFHPNEEDTTKSKKLHPQSWIPINTPVLSIPSNNFFWQDFFCVLFYFWSTMKITQNYMKLYALSRFSRTLNLLRFCIEGKRNFEYSALLTQALLVYWVAFLLNQVYVGNFKSSFGFDARPQKLQVLKKLVSVKELKY